MSTAKRVAKNVFSLFTANIISNILSFFVTVYIARKFGATFFGMIAFATALVSYFSILSSLGIETVAIRDVSRDKSLTREYAGSLIVIRLLSSLLAFWLLFFIIGILKFSAVKYLLIIIYGLGFFATSLNLSWVFSAHEKMEYTGLLSIINPIIYFVGVFVILHYSNSILIVPAMQLAASLLTVFLSLLLFIKLFNFPAIKINLNYWKTFLSSAIPIGISIIFVRVYYNIDTIILSFMKGDEVVGWYNAAYKIILVLIGFSEFYFASIFPILSQQFKESRQKLDYICKTSMRFLIIIAVPLGLGGIILAESIINSVFGVQYVKCVPAFQILIGQVVLNYIGGLFAYGLLAFNREKVYFKLVVLTAILNIVLNFLLIPLFSLYGAAIATVLSIGIVFFFWLNEFNKVVNIDIISFFIKPLIAGVGMALIIFFLKDLNVFFVILTGIILYLIFLSLIKGILLEDINLLKTILKRNSNA